MPRTLYARLSLALAALLVLVGVLFAVLTISATRDYLQEVSQRFNRDLPRDLVADRNLVQQGKLDLSALKETFHHYMVINPSIEIYLLDPDGSILAYSSEPGKVKRRAVSLEPIKRLLNGERSFSLLGDDPRSHDLGTPLASLHGYMETLRIKEGSLQSAERIEYLDIALRHGMRLRRLVEDLFELAKLDASDVRPSIEPVSLAELAQDVVHKYHLAAQRKGARLELEGGCGSCPSSRPTSD